MLLDNKVTVTALRETICLMAEADDVIESAGGWAIKL